MWRSRSALSVAAVMVSVLSGCSSKDSGGNASPSTGGDGGTHGASCATRGAECLQIQEICESDGNTETCVPCPAGQYAKTADACAPLDGTEVSHVFPEYALGPGDESDDVCQSWSLGNETEVWVNGVVLDTNGGYHHSNWLFVPDTMYPGDDGVWNCNDRKYSELEAAVAGGVLFAQSTQATHQVQKFPEGVAVRLPPHAKIIGGTHLLNTTADSLNTTLSIAVYEVDASTVKVPLAPFRLTYHDLTIPAQATSEFTGACDFSAVVPNGTPGDLDMDLYYVMPHYHVLGHSFHLETYGGANDGKAIFDIGAFDGEAHGTPIDPPLSMRGSQGFRFSCGYENPRSKDVGWGIGDQEMCVMLAFARSDFAFDGSVNAGAAAGKNGSTFEYTGDCAVIPLDFARGKGSLGGDAGAH
ncbi:MAG TPA: hypothetical protein VHE30_20495 [Polyangiaceae bacterium]|nr:hypothetical protein [Polyangiaceae bacterium]